MILTDDMLLRSSGSEGKVTDSSNVFKTVGKGTMMRFAIGQCSLGAILVATSDIGIFAIMLGDDPEFLLHDLERRFPKAELVSDDRMLEKTVAKVVGYIENPQCGWTLPLDIRGTAFQQNVWLALQKIPLGSTASYGDVAKMIGHPKSMRAVAQACSANHIAVAIPCHRVVRTDGGLSGYRWGVERKAALLKREKTRCSVSVQCDN